MTDLSERDEQSVGVPFFRTGNYAPADDELTEFDLPVVEGAIPAELDGWYLRNGPNPVRRMRTGSPATA